MRTDEEFKAEIYKRGREKLQSKKAGRIKLISGMSIGVVAACCVLIISVVSPLVMDENNGQKSESNKSEKYFNYKDFEEIENTSDNYKYSNEDSEEDLWNDKDGMCIEETKTTGTADILVVQMKSDSDVSVIEEVSDCGKLEAFVEIIAEIEKEGLKNDERDTLKVSGTATSEFTYTLSLGIDGITKEYSLKGNVLILLETKEEYILNDKQLEELHNVIR